MGDCADSPRFTHPTAAEGVTLLLANFQSER